MLQPLTRFIALYAIIRWIKPRWFRLAIFFISLALISYSHTEYLGYVEVTKDTSYLAFSYILKYSAFLILILTFVISLKFLPFKDPTKPEKTNHKVIEKPTETNDGFDFLRGKKKLESRSDKIYGKNNG